MPMDKWPCNPESFSSILPGDLPYFLQTGATNALGRPVSIIDPEDEKIRYDAIEKFDKFRPMCKVLRKKIGKIWDEKCTHCDLLVAKQLIAEGCKPNNIVRYRCYMGLEECAAIIRIGNLPVMVVSGQFKPPEGLDDTDYVLSQLGKQQLPDSSKLSSTMRQSLSRFRIPDEQWLGEPLSEENRNLLLTLAKAHEEINSEIIEKFKAEISRIAKITQSYYDLARAKVEAQIMESLASAMSGALPQDNAELWGVVEGSLETLREALNLEYVAFFSGEEETDTLLILKASFWITTPSKTR